MSSISFHKYGVTLRQIGENDLETVRVWRNAKHVQEQMEFQEEISVGDQQKWFAELDKSSNFYFLIEVEGEKIGVMHLKAVNWLLEKGEAGIFIGNEKWLGTPEAVKAILCFMDFWFEVVGMKTLEAKIRTGNSVAVEMNQALGYEGGTDEKSAFRWYRVGKEAYLASLLRTRMGAARQRKVCWYAVDHEEVGARVFERINKGKTKAWV